MRNKSAFVGEQFQKLDSFNGIDVYSIKTDKFKTNTINIFFQDNLDRSTAAKNALIPAVLRRGCGRLPTYREIALYLEELYGAAFDCGVTKKGERQITQFYIEYIADKYADKDSGLFEKCFELLFDVITDPIVENGAFKGTYMEQEKQNLSNLIASRVNDKVQYAVERCFEEMCKDERFGVYDYGYIEDVKKISSSELYAYYLQMIHTHPMQVFITGDIEEQKIRWMVDKLRSLKRGTIKKVDITHITGDVGEVKNVGEKLNVNQGKLSLGFRTGISSKDSQYYPLVVCNGILGGGVNSKLFQNVREKASLAYYVFSRLEKFKGLMIISSGIEAANKDQAIDIILKQIEEIRNGNISEEEFRSAVNTIETGARSLADSQIQMVDYYLSQVIVETNDDFETLIEKVKKVTKQDVIKAAESIKLDTVYFLAGMEGESE